MKKRIKDIKISEIFVLILIILAFFFMNYITVYMGEDDYQVVYYQGENFSLVISSIISTFAYWSVRSGQALLRFIGYFPKDLFNIINTIVTVSCIYLIKIFAFGKKKSEHNDFYFLFAATFILLFTPALYDIFFWMAGACNHLWGTVFTLLALVPFRYLLDEYDFFANKKLLLLLYFPFCFIAGATLENFGLFIFLAVFLTILYNYIKNKKINKWSIIAAILLLAGNAILTFSPTTQVRKVFFANTFFYFNLPEIRSFKDIFIKFLILFKAFMKDFSFLFKITEIALFILILVLLIRKRKAEKKVIISIISFFVATTTLVPFLFSSYYSNRPFLVINFFIIVIFINIIDITRLLNKKIIKCIVSTVLFAIFVNRFFELSKLYLQYNTFYYQRNDYILKQIERKTEVINFPVYMTDAPHQIMIVKDENINQETLARFYKIDYDFEFNATVVYKNHPWKNFDKPYR